MSTTFKIDCGFLLFVCLFVCFSSVSTNCIWSFQIHYLTAHNILWSCVIWMWFCLWKLHSIKYGLSHIGFLVLWTDKENTNCPGVQADVGYKCHCSSVILCETLPRNCTELSIYCCITLAHGRQSLWHEILMESGKYRRAPGALM